MEHGGRLIGDLRTSLWMVLYTLNTDKMTIGWDYSSCKFPGKDPQRQGTGGSEGGDRE